MQQHLGKRAASDLEATPDGSAAADLMSEYKAASADQCESMNVEQAGNLLEQHTDFRQVEAVGA